MCCLDEVGYVYWYFFNLGVVELFNFVYYVDIISSDKVDCNIFVIEMIIMINVMNVVFMVGGEIVVDD